MGTMMLPDSMMNTSTTPDDFALAALADWAMAEQGGRTVAVDEGLFTTGVALLGCLAAQADPRLRRSVDYLVAELEEYRTTGGVALLKEGMDTVGLGRLPR
jgi:hypothetical protein